MNKKKIIIYQIGGFVLIIFFIWLNEVFDLPHVIFKTPPTPNNVAESILESLAVLCIVVFTVGVSIKLLKEIRHLENFLRICCMCKKIYDCDKKEWLPMENYFDTHSKVKFSHCFCPECFIKYEKHQYEQDGE